MGESVQNSADDVGWVYTHPLLEERPVDTAEVDGVLKVFTVCPTGGIKRRIFCVESAFHPITNDKGTAAGSMVGSAGVVSDAPTKLREGRT